MDAHKNNIPSINTKKNVGSTTIIDNIGLTIQVYEDLLQQYPKEIVDNACTAIQYIQQATGKAKNVNKQQLQEICKTLTLYRNSDEYFGIADMHKRDGGKKFDSNYANLSYTMIKEDLKYGRTERIKELEKYIQPGSISADLFCGSPKINGRDSSVHGSVLLHSLLGVSNVLEIDLFNQETKHQTNSDDDEYNKEIDNRNYHFVIHNKVKEESRGEQFNAPERGQPPFEEYIPKIDITHLKMDALQSLQTMSDGSLDSVMINNVDYSIVSDDDYIADLQKELERVIKKDGIIFGWSADRVRPKDANIVYQENGRIGFKIIQNTRK